MIQIPHLPKTLDELIAIRNDIATTAEGGAAVFILAMHMFSQDRDLGLRAFTISLDRSLLREDPKGYKGFAPDRSLDYFLNSQLSPKPYIAQSYFLGTSPENGYQIPADVQMDFTRNPYSEHSDGSIKVFAACSGADTPRPVTLKANNRGIWKVTNCSSLFVGVRPARTSARRRSLIDRPQNPGPQITVCHYVPVLFRHQPSPIHIDLISDGR